MNKNINFTYMTQPAKKYTFEAPKLREWVENKCKGRVLNLFAGKTRLNVDETRVDIDPEVEPDVNMDAYGFVCNSYDKKWDTVILDPPWNYRKAREKYNGRWIGKLTKTKDRLLKILTPEAMAISVGYDSVGMSKKRGFYKTDICLVCFGGDHNDAIVVVEKKDGQVPLIGF